MLKTDVLTYYGLMDKCTGSLARPDTAVRDMFGESIDFLDAEVGPLWPATYKNWSKRCARVAVPVDLADHPQLYLVLPVDLFDAYDGGRVVLLPQKGSKDVLVHVLHHDAASTPADLKRYHGRKLLFPSGKRPDLLMLAFFAEWAAHHAKVALDSDEWRAVRAAGDAFIGRAKAASGSAR